MNMHDEIKKAYDNVHAPDGLSDRIREGLYQMDMTETEFAEKVTFEAVSPSRRPVMHYLLYTAASLALCFGIGISIWSIRERKNDFHPASHVDVVQDTTEPEETLPSNGNP